MIQFNLRFSLFQTFIFFIILCINNTVYAQWQQTGGPGGGFLDEIVKIEETLIISAIMGGIYRSDDQSQTWYKSVEGLPDNPRVDYIATDGTNLYAAVENNGVFISEDKGMNWKPANEGMEYESIYSIYADEQTVFAISAYGIIYYSEDRGQSWTEKGAGLEGLQIHEITKFKGEYYSADKVLYKYSNIENRWLPIVIPGMDVNGPSALHGTDDIFYVGTLGDIHISEDGINWIKSAYHFPGSNTKIENKGDSVYVTSFKKILLSTDKGINWKEFNNNYLTDWPNDVEFLNDRILMTTSLGLFSSFDQGETWEINRSILNQMVSSLQGNDRYLVAGTSGHGVFLSTDQGASWESKIEGLDNMNARYIDEIVIVDNNIFIGTDDGAYKYNESTQAWDLILKIGENMSVNSIAYDKGLLVAIINDDALHYSRDMGKTWTRPENVGMVFTGYADIALQGDTVLVATNDGGTYLSVDLGASWNNISIPNHHALPYDIEIKDSLIFMASYNGLYRSKDMGANWAYVHYDQLNVFDIEIIGEKLYVASPQGIYVSSIHRDLFSKELNKLNIVPLSLHEQDGYLYAGTYGHSVWKINIESINIPPMVVAPTSQLKILEDGSLELSVEQFRLDDPDNEKEELKITILEGTNYSVENGKIIPQSNFNGTLKVKIQVFDGSELSEEFLFDVVVEAVNDAPVITSFNSSSLIYENDVFTLYLENFTVTDPDNNFPGDFSLIINEGANYTFEDNVITPSIAFDEDLIISVQVSDGKLSSEDFVITLRLDQILNIEKDLSKIFLYPNPANDILKIRHHNFMGTLAISFFDLRGNLLVSQSFDPSLEGTYEVPVSSFAKGIYLIKIEEAGNHHFAKIIIE